MFSTFFKLSLRRLRQNPLFSLLQIGGLALGIATALLLWTYISAELSFNRYHQKTDQLYRILIEDKDGTVSDYTPPALAPWLKKEFPEIQNFARTNSNSEGVVSSFGTSLNEDKPRHAFREVNTIAYADGDVFRLFSFESKRGKINIDQAQEVAISESYAKKYFGNDDPLGMTLKLNNQFGALPYTITGVFKDMPETSDYRFDLLFSLRTLENPANLNGNDWAALNTWYSASYASFVELRDGTDLDRLEQKINAGLKKVLPENESRVRLQPLAEMHLGKSNDDQYPTFANRSLILALGAITFLILFIAWANYVNLSTAQGYQQVQNVGIRRTIGATRIQVAAPYFMDSLLLTAFGVLIALPLIAGFRPMVSSMIGRDINPFSLFGQSYLWLFVAVVLLGTATAGAYIAWLLSGVKPVQMLNKQAQGSRSGIGTRNVLVIVQFAISILFIIGALVMQRQLHFMQGKNLGMNLEQILVIRGPESGKVEERKQNLNVLRSELEKYAWVEDFCFTGCLPGATFNQNFSTAGFASQFSTPEEIKKNYTIAMVDHLFQPTYEIPLLAGKNLTAEDARNGYSQSNTLLLNETAARQMGFDRPVEAAGQLIKWNDQNMLVKGVLKDYHNRGLQQAIEPMVFLPSTNSNLISIRVGTEQLTSHLTQLKELYSKLFPTEPYEYYFEKDDFDKQYLAEQRLGNIATAASFMAVLLSCFGLLGLIIHSIGRRTKEIGIRKVLGASIASITNMLTLDFLKLVLIAILLASPIAGYFMQQWLSGFAYHINLDWWIFALAGTMALLIAGLTVGILSVKAAMTNPVEVLKTE